jgi:hypothetical protein
MSAAERLGERTFHKQKFRLATHLRNGVVELFAPDREDAVVGGELIVRR